MKGYEAHLTFVPNGDGYGNSLRFYAQTHPRWTFSCIDGDPVLGPGLKMYLTAHSNDLRSLQDLVDAAVRELYPVRAKLELILEDRMM